MPGRPDQEKQAENDGRSGTRGRRFRSSREKGAGDLDPETRAKDEAKRTKLLSEEGLREAALRHLDRYDASRKQLETVLLRRVRKYAHPEEVPPLKQRVDELLQRFIESRLIDDTRFSKTFVAQARERGASTLKIKQKLLARGVSSELVDEGLTAARETDGHDDRTAALTFAKKRRLETRFDLKDPKERGKALATLARQGFSFDAANDALRCLGAAKGDDLDD
jgi:regulatory protein